MKTPADVLHRLPPSFCYAAGTVLLGAATILMMLHVRAIQQVREVGVPIVSRLPSMERMVASLQEQVELAELHSAVQSGSPEETMRVFSLPEQTDLGRLMAVFDAVRDVYGDQGLLADMSDIVLGDTVDIGDGARAQSARVELVVHEDAMRSVLLLIRLSGIMTVGDVLTERELQTIVSAVETENPTGIVALEQFLATDLPAYAENPKLYEDQLLRSFATPAFLNTFQNVVRSSLLREAQSFFVSDLGRILLRYKLWPMQIMTVEEVSLQPGSAPRWHRLGLVFRVYSAAE